MKLIPIRISILSIAHLISVGISIFIGFWVSLVRRIKRIEMEYGENDTRIPNGARSNDTAYIVLTGLTGAGKSSTMNAQFDRTCRTDEGIFSSATESILEYQVEARSDLGPCKKNLVVIDTPGFGHTTSERMYEMDSQILATLDSVLSHHTKLKTCFPTALFLVIDFTDLRIDAEHSHFVQLLKALEHLIQRGTLIDTNPNTCNLIVVLTHFMDAPGDLQKSPESRIRLIQGLIKTFTSIPANIPIVMAENKAIDFGLSEVDGNYELANGDLYPMNLFKALKQVSDKACNPAVTNAIVDTYNATSLLTKQVLQEVELVGVETESARSYYEIITNTEASIHENEMSNRLQTEWTKVCGSHVSNNPIVLQIAKTIFFEAGIDSVRNIPTNAEDILQLVQKLVVTRTLEKVLGNLDINPPCLLDHCKSVGYIYDIRNNLMIEVTPFVMTGETITHSGFKAPPLMRVDLIGNASIKSITIMASYKSSKKYFKSRLKQLHLESMDASIGNPNVDPVLGHNIVPEDLVPETLTGIREFREYSVALANEIRFSTNYINTLENLSEYNEHTKQNWSSHISQGVHVIESAFIGGAISVTATRNVDVDTRTSVEVVFETIKVLLENVGNVNGCRRLQPINDWKFEIKFHGGNPNIKKPNLDNIFSVSGRKLFDNWKQSIQLHPKLLLSELHLVPISHYLQAGHPELSEQLSIAYADHIRHRISLMQNTRNSDTSN